MSAKTLEYILKKAADWLFRKRSVELMLIRAAMGLIAIVFAGPHVLELILRLTASSVAESNTGIQSAISVLDEFDRWILMLCAIVIVVALLLHIKKSLDEAKSQAQSRTIVLEARGLRDDNGIPLKDPVSVDTSSQVVPILLDLRNNLDGEVIKPERAIEKIIVARNSVEQHIASQGEGSTRTVYGGLSPVPYTFLTGVLFDDEGEISTYDWDRVQQRWRALEEADDGRSFELSGEENLGTSDDLVLAVSFSYVIKDEDLKKTFSHPVVRLTLDGVSSDAHWSEEKQSRLAQEFLELLKQADASGVKRVHLVLAAPNSVVFNFGRRYDKRNLPPIAVYQYERERSIPYPWAISMPVAGAESPKVIQSVDPIT